MELYTRKFTRAPSVLKTYSDTSITKDILGDVSKYFGIYLPNSQFILVNGDITKDAILIRNIPIVGSRKFFKPEIGIYSEDYFNSISEFRIFSYPNKPRVLFGKWLDEPRNTNYIQPQAKKVNYYNVLFNFNNIIAFKNFTFNKWNFLYFEHQLLTYRFKPKYEYILYPFIGTKHYSYYYHQFENENTDQVTTIMPPECKDDVYMSEWDYLLNRPKFMFSVNGIDWKIWDFENSTWKDVNPSNGQYFTFDEFFSNAMTYQDYLNIPDDAFNSSEDWYVMCNNYLLGFVIRQKYYEDVLGVTKFIHIKTESEIGHKLYILER